RDSYGAVVDGPIRLLRRSRSRWFGCFGNLPASPESKLPLGVRMLEARSLTKYYNHTVAVKDVSFTIRPGEILGYLGPNGAGKSTTVKMLTGLLDPSGGRVLFHGEDIRRDL